MDAIQQRIEADHPNQSLGTHIRLIPLRDQGVADVRLALLILLGAVALVLLIACANIANLLVVRTAARSKEIAIRLAVGADWFRLVRQLLTESLVLAAAGAGLGLLIAYSAIQLLIRQVGANIAVSTPGWEQIGIDRGVLLFTIALALLSTLVFGCAPAWRATKTDLLSSLKQGQRGGAGAGGTRQRLQSALATAQIAMSLTLLIAAALLIQSFARLEQVEPGFHRAGLLTVQLDLPRRSYPTDQARAAFFDRLLPQLRALPGAQSVDMATSTPFESGGNANFNWSITVDSRERDATGKLISADWRAITPDYFRTMGIALVKGRFFTEHDTKDSQSVALVNEAFVRANVPAGQEPLGTHVGDFGGHSTGAGAIIVGVVRDFKQVGLDADVRRDVYTPQAQTPWTNSRVVVMRTGGDPSMLANPVRNELKTLDADLPITSLETMDALISSSVAQPRFRTLLLSLFAALALILTAIGIYGVIAYSVAQRTNEIGIRMALGAQRSAVLSLILRKGMMLAGIGIAIGLAGASAATRFLGSLLYDIKATDPLTFAGVSVFLLIVALMACYIPARRAASTDPMTALRAE
jgi:putative ABC transport system permease protein